MCKQLIFCVKAATRLIDNLSRFLAILIMSCGLLARNDNYIISIVFPIFRLSAYLMQVIHEVFILRYSYLNECFFLMESLVSNLCTG